MSKTARSKIVLAYVSLLLTVLSSIADSTPSEFYALFCTVYHRLTEHVAKGVGWVSGVVCVRLLIAFFQKLPWELLSIKCQKTNYSCHEQKLFDIHPRA